MIPADDLRVDNLVASVSLALSDRQGEKATLREISSRLTRIERALAIPVTYSLAQACARLGFSVSTGRKHPERLPTPVKFLPLKYRVEDVEALAAKPREERGVPFKEPKDRR